MANKNPVKKWKKGQSGNPKGQPRVEGYIKDLRRINSQILSIKINEFINKSAEELAAIQKDPSAALIDKILIRFITKSFDNSDQGKLNFLLERMVGKVPEEINFGALDTSTAPIKNDLSKLSMKELLALKEIREKIDKAS